MSFLKNCPDFWGPWNHASLTSVSKKNKEIKIGIRKGFSLKGLLAVRKHFSLEECKRQESYKEPGTVGILVGNLVGWTWLRSQVFPHHLKWLHPYHISHPRPLGSSFSNFSWEEMSKLGQWTLHQGDVTVRHKKTEVRYRWRVHKDHVYGIAERLRGEGNVQLETIGLKNIRTIPEPIEILQENFYDIRIFENDVYFSTHLEVNKEEIRAQIEERAKIPKSQGAIRDTIESIITIFGINSLKTPDRGWLTSLMRRASVLLKGWNIYLWDNCFIGMMAAYYYPELALGNLHAICSELTNHGFLPNQAHPMGRSEGITQMPVASHCALKVHQIMNAPIDSLLPALVSNNSWWIANRDPNRYYLLSFGSELKEKCTAALRQTAQYESGMDNHAMFHKVPMDYKTGCMALYNVALSSIYALDCLCLSELTQSCGMNKISEKLKKRYEKLKKAINTHLWDGETYRNRYWNGDFQKELFPSYLFPLIAGIPSQEQAKSAVKKILNKCLTPFGVAPSTIDHPFFKQQITWRGRILPPLQYLISESLRRYEFDLEASHLARRCYRCYHKEWTEDSHFHESYNSMTGDGDDVSITGEPGHPWAALLPYLSVQDLIDYEFWNGLRVGRLEPFNASIKGIPIRDQKYSVEIENNLQTISRDNIPLITSSYPTILRKFVYSNQQVDFIQKALKPVEIQICVAPGTYEITLNDEKFQERVAQTNQIELSLSRLENRVCVNKLE